MAGLGMTNANITTVLKQTLQAYFGVGLGNFGWSIGQQTTFGAGTTAGSGGAWYPTPQFGSLGGGGGPVSAGIGQASTLGRLTVPAGSPGATPSAMEGEGPVLANSVRPIAPTSNAMLNGVPMGAGNLAGARRGGDFVVRYGFRHAVMPRPPSAPDSRFIRARFLSSTARRTDLRPPARGLRGDRSPLCLCS